VRRLAAAAVVVWAIAARAEPLARFFVMGDGRLALQNVHSGARADVRYRRADGTYDDAALARLRAVFARDRPGPLSLRLVELMSWLQDRSGSRPLRLMSGYRSPTYNEALRRRDVRAAKASLHTEGLAADIAFPHARLRDLWMQLRDLDCCGAGFYEREGFLHVDVGRSRFWEPETSRVEEDLSGGNARLFARTEYDRYRAGEPIVVRLHAVTAPPVRVERRAVLGGAVVPLDGGPDGCLAIDATGAVVRVPGVGATARGPLAFTTCEPRAERTPERVETNPVEVR